MTIDNTLDTIAWAETNFGSLITNRQCTRRDVMRAVAAGLAKSAGDVVMCDDNGATLDPERYREGFQLTESGKQRLQEWQTRLGERPIRKAVQTKGK